MSARNLAIDGADQVPQPAQSYAQHKPGLAAARASGTPHPSNQIRILVQKMQFSGLDGGIAPIGGLKLATSLAHELGIPSP